MLEERLPLQQKLSSDVINFQLSCSLVVKLQLFILHLLTKQSFKILKISFQSALADQKVKCKCEIHYQKCQYAEGNVHHEGILSLLKIICDQKQDLNNRGNTIVHDLSQIRAHD